MADAESTLTSGDGKVLTADPLAEADDMTELRLVGSITTIEMTDDEMDEVTSRPRLPFGFGVRQSCPMSLR